MLKLIVNADDFGMNEIVNNGVLKSFNEGVLRSASIMANGSSFEHAVKIIKSNPELDIGIHVTLVGEKPVLKHVENSSLIDSMGQFHSDSRRFTSKYILQKISMQEVRKEIGAQFEKVMDYGIRISHADSHQHIHLLPKIFDIVSENANKYKIKFIRFPNERFMYYMFSDGFSLTRVFQLLVIKLGCKVVKNKRFNCSDHFTGFFYGGNLSPTNLLKLLQNLPSDGVCELMCHPGKFVTSEKRGNQYRVVEETDSLINQNVIDYIEQKNIKIISFRDLPF